MFGSFQIESLATVNACLNGLATILLLIGYVLIKSRAKAKDVVRIEWWHKVVMISAFVVSAIFLVCYLIYHANVLHVRFTAQGPVRYLYFTILISHILLAISVPVLAIMSMYYGFRVQEPPVAGDPYRHKHRRLTKWAFPIWLYVSVTGVIIYLMLYIYPGGAEIETSSLPRLVNWLHSSC
ncbi:DUF420 domain-containing protein [Planctomycetales bacterium 10988]|nr:DUF420 domain-containing protein [Planctomycetales bacterium 10988]